MSRTQRSQLELIGLEASLNAVAAEPSPTKQRQLRQRIEVAHEILSDLPNAEELAFLHSGLCQTFLPHSRPPNDNAIWQRSAGRFHLLVSPGAIVEEGKAVRVGVPYGPKARLILIYLQTEGLKDKIVQLGPSMSAWIRSLGLPVTGGARGSIQAVRQQALRIARCSFTLQWDAAGANGETRTLVQESRIVEGLELWTERGEGRWAQTVELSDRFHAHLREHAVPLDRRAIAYLADNSLGLDLYALFAYRLPRLTTPLHLRWGTLRAQLGAGDARVSSLAQRIRQVLPDVLAVYPDAQIECGSYGLTLKPSPAAVPRTQMQGFRLITQAQDLS
jgi:hypothetical protein